MTGNDDYLELMGTVIQGCVRECHDRAVEAGWWTDLATGEKKERNVGEALMLIVSEIAEGMEGHRKNVRDDHLPEFDSLTVELADALIRIFDLAGGLNLELGKAVAAKLKYNERRADHRIENRVAGGKAY